MDWEQLKRQLRTDPKRTVRFITGLSITLILLWMMVPMQSEPRSGYVDMNSLQAGHTDVSSSGSHLSEIPDEESTTRTLSEIPAVGGSASGKGVAGWTLFLMLAAGSGAYWYARKQINGITTSKSEFRPASALSVLETVDLNAGQNLSVVRVGSEYWIVSSGNQGVNLMKTVSCDEWEKQEIAESAAHRESVSQVRSGETENRQHSDNRFMSLIRTVRNKQAGNVS